jgi:ribose 5-phosphate isomerase A
LPIEVVPFACKTEQLYLESIGGSVTLRVDENELAFLTNQQNFILDTHFGQISDPARLGSRLNDRAGIVEHGLFLGLATDVIVAGRKDIRHLRRNDSR